MRAIESVNTFCMGVLMRNDSFAIKVELSLAELVLTTIIMIHKYYDCVKIYCTYLPFTRQINRKL